MQPDQSGLSGQVVADDVPLIAVAGSQGTSSQPLSVGDPGVPIPERLDSELRQFCRRKGYGNVNRLSPFVKREVDRSDWWVWAENRGLNPSRLSRRAPHYEAAVEEVFSEDEAIRIKGLASDYYYEKVDRLDIASRDERVLAATRSLSYQEALQSVSGGLGQRVEGLVSSKIGIPGELNREN